jgi:hypothetical protein
MVVVVDYQTRKWGRPALVLPSTLTKAGPLLNFGVRRQRF